MRRKPGPDLESGARFEYPGYRAVLLKLPCVCWFSFQTQVKSQIFAGCKFFFIGCFSCLERLFTLKPHRQKYLCMP
uniref:Uncharacterized protein n=1 Tax=Anguilla anguilla TaxID=7936 RepID=A0A0E9XG82_ANGAN